MISKNSSLDEIKQLIKNCLSQLYEKDPFLFQRNQRKGICERCLVFRFAYYLQTKINNFFVDCDFNSSFEGFIGRDGRMHGVTERSGKLMRNEDGTVTKRFVDIIVHKRDYLTRNDFICFEIKKWNNSSTRENAKDRNNLRRLTSDYGYLYGFHIKLGKTKEATRWSVFQRGRIIEDNLPVFENEN